MKTLHVVRHGQASWHGEDYDELTDLGREQAGVVGTAFARRRITPDLVVSGALRRHRHTADLAIETAGWSLGVQVDERWAEFDHVDLVARFDPAYPTHADLARALAETDGERTVARLMRDAMGAWVTDAGDGGFAETFDEFCVRVWAAADAVLEQIDDEQVAVVFASGGTIGALALRALAGPPEQWLRLAISANGAISTFVELDDDGGLVLSTLNDLSHLDAAGVLTFRAEPAQRSTDA